MSVANRSTTIRLNELLNLPNTSRQGRECMFRSTQLPPMDDSPALKFGHFELQANHRRLLRNGEPVPLGARAFDVLLALAERRERIVTKAELMERVWPGLVVEENNLQVQISSLRRQLGSDAIATIPGQGYRFTARLAGNDEPGAALRQRLAAILAADAVGYSRLMAIDERTTIEALEAARRVFRDRIQSNQGRVIDTAGDSVLAVFETATGAVTAALAVQGELDRLVATSPADRMRFRIGVHLGDVIEKSDGTIYGDGVNIAARLQALADPGGVTVSESIHTAVRGKVDGVFEDQGEQQAKNIPYQVRTYRLSARGRAKAAPEADTKLVAREIDLALPDKPSLAVLPFANMSGDATQDYFVDGVVDDIITALSRVRSFFVVARTSSFTYKGRSVDIKQVGRDLGVRYVLQGSFRKAGSKVRIAGELIEAQSERHIWSERFEGSLDDIFELQDRIAASVVGAIEPTLRLAEIERARSKPTANLGAYDLCLRALPRLPPASTKEGNDEAIALLTRAIEMDPGYSYAKAVCAYAHTLRKLQTWASDAEIAEGMRLAREALSDHRDDPGTLSFAGHALAVLGLEHEDALRAIDRALTLNPNSTAVLTRAGWIRTYIGDGAAALEFFHRAMRLNPLDPELGQMQTGLAYAYSRAGRDREALEAGLKALQEAPSWIPAHLSVVRSLVLLGRINEARAAAQRMLKLSPGMTLASRAKRTLFRDQAFKESILNALREAGVPE